MPEVDPPLRPLRQNDLGRTSGHGFASATRRRQPV